MDLENKELTLSEPFLLQRAVHGGFWVFALRISQQLFRLGRLIILARILAPYDFGLIGIALLMVAVLETFSQTGFQAALIQKKEEITPYLDIAWTVLVLRGFILFIILYLVAPYVELFFKVYGAKVIIQVIGFSFLLRAFSNIGVVHFQKELEFNKQFIYQFSGTLVDFIVSISAAFILKSVWALVFGLLAGEFTRFIVSYWISSWRPRFRLELEKLGELFNFGKWILGSSVLIFLITQGDDAFVGKLLGVTMLGFYQMAYRISNLPATEITHVISQVAFPTYSKLQNNILELRRTYLKVLLVTTFLSFPIAGLIFILAPDFTRVFLGEKWIPMISAMQVLALAGLVRSIAATTGVLFYAIGKPKIDTKWQVVRLLIIITFIYPLSVKLGILGTSIAVFVSILFSNMGFMFDCVKIIKCSKKELAKKISIPFVNVVIMSLLILTLKSFIEVNMMQIVFLAFVGILIYFVGIGLSNMIFDYGMNVVIKESFQGIIKKGKI